MEYIIYCYGSEIIGLILCAIAGIAGVAFKRLYQKHVNDDTKRAIARTVVAFVEQVWKDIHGPEKLKKALETAAVLLKKKGINFDAEEMEILIEAAVAEFNDAFRKPVESENAKATYQIPKNSVVDTGN